MLLEQMSLWQLEYVQIGPMNLPSKFDQNRASNSRDIAGQMSPGQMLHGQLSI